eukprot:403341554
MEAQQKQQTSDSDTPISYTSLDYLVSKYSYFLFDCDGVLWTGEKQVPHVFEAIHMLINHPEYSQTKKVFLVTNNSTRTRHQVLNEKLKNYGFHDSGLKENQIYTSAYVTAKYLSKALQTPTHQHHTHHNSKPKVYVVGEQGLKDEMKLNGIEVVNGKNEDDEEHSDANVSMGADEIGTREVEEGVGAVVCGINYSFSYRKLCMASLYIQLNEAKFIATNIDRYLTTQVKDRHMPAGGSIVNCISYGTQVQPIVIGKPQQHIFDVLREEHGLLEEPLSKFLMVGDSLITDIRFGNNCGISTLCVLSGNTTEAKIKEIFIKGLRNEDEGVPTYISPYFGFNS